MAELSDKQVRFLDGVERGQRMAGPVGCLMALAGCAYIAWAVVIFDPRADPREQPGWDRPIAQLADLYRPFAPLLNAIRPQTENEKLLHTGVQRNIAFSSGIMILLVRVLVGTILCLGGLAALTVVVERRRLLVLVTRLRDPASGA